MPEGRNPVAAVHYYYLLKSDDKKLGEVWSRLSGGAGGGEGGLKSLPATEAQPGELCSIVHRIEASGLDLCLATLPGIAVVEAVYHAAENERLNDRWRAALKQLNGDRDRVLSGDVSLFSETTLLVTGEHPGEEVAAAACEVTGIDDVLASSLDPATAGGGSPRLLCLPEDSGARRAYYALAADNANAVLSTIFPEVDSQIRKIDYSASYFEQQRLTIAQERSEADKQVGALLHRQIVAGKGRPKTTEMLEEQITSLSKIYGVLATDSLLIRDSGEQLENDIHGLDRSLGSILSRAAWSEDEIGAHYSALFNGKLADIRDETRNLDFSRENARAAVEIVRTEVEIMRAGEDAAIQSQTRELLHRSLTLQQERLALRVAATFVEFVLVFYYVLKSWEGVVGTESFEQIPSFLRMLVVLMISGGTAIGTHFVAQGLQRRKLKGRSLFWLVLAVGTVVSATAVMIIATVTSAR